LSPGLNDFFYGLQGERAIAHVSDFLNRRFVPLKSTKNKCTSMALIVEPVYLAKQGDENGNRRKKYLHNRQRTLERLVPSIPGEPGQ
jgi:hypothetical protein